MVLHPDCDYLSKNKDSEFAPPEGLCDECYRWEICIKAYMSGKNPIPLNQLPAFKGKEVWVQSPGVPEYGRIAVVEDVDITAGKSILWLVNDFTCHDYGNTWEAYPMENSMPISYTA